MGAGFLARQLRRLRRRLHRLHRRPRRRLRQARLEHPGHGRQLHPRPLPGGSGGTGPCGKEVHCESYVPTEAIWDLAARDLPSPGTGVGLDDPRPPLVPLAQHRDQRPSPAPPARPTPRTAAAPARSGRRMRAVDDDDGNLANGTPHGGALFAAFNRHGIACTTDAGACDDASPAARRRPRRRSPSPPATTRPRSPGRGSARRSTTCSATRPAATPASPRSPPAAPATSLADTNVANGLTYFYQVTAYPSGNEACASLALDLHLGHPDRHHDS